MKSIINTKLNFLAILEESSVVTILSVTVTFFLILLILGIKKSFKLRAENERLSRTGFSSEEDNKVYRDFREGHLYDNY